MHIVFILAHQDDEIAFASRIRAAVGRGDQVTCVCLTDGAFASPAAVRDAESRRVLKLLGVENFLVGPPEQRIADGTLPEHLDRALEFVDGNILSVDEVVTLAWEGGHQDHDATHLVASVFARRRGVPCVEMPLYNGFAVRDPLFRVNKPVGDGWTERKLPRRQFIANVLLARFYPSQRRTWLGLAPLFLISRPREFTRVADLRRATRPPHPLPLLYERRFHYPYDRFARHAEEFLRRQWVPD